MRIAIVTDAWVPQVNGVVRTLQALGRELEDMGHELLILSPDGFRSLPCPTYPEIRLALASPSAVGLDLTAFAPDAIHLSTEGPLGIAARRWCLARKMPFTTAYHTHFPAYLAARTRIDPDWVWPYVRWFHAPSAAVLVSTPTLAKALNDRQLKQTHAWGRGIDTHLFSPHGPPHPDLAALPRPLLLYVGRVAVEKNVEAFCTVEHPGTKVVIGDGPARATLTRRFPHVRFIGTREGPDLAAAYRAADVLVFPSRTDTFGLVMTEALACGTPVAAFPVAGPSDVLTAEVGAMDEDLARATRRALGSSRATCASYARRFSWQESARQFIAALVPIDRTTSHAA